MNFQSAKILILAFTALSFSISLRAEIVSATIQTPPPAQAGYFKLGTTRNPAGQEISVDSRSLLLDGQPWFPVMGEFHYARVPENEWRDELLKMKAGGVDIVSTYVFWIHHEEVEGQWDWSGRRDFRKFLQTCNDAGLKVVVRCGPWCHGEVRNGGFPDWVVMHKDWKLRSTDPNFLAAVKILYAQIALQMRGELWKDGGPVIGIQVDNEYGGSPAYLLALKKIAIESGIDVPLYTKTGWPEMRRPVPPGELLPLFGAYADGFWDRNLKPMNGNAWENFTFKITRTDTGIGNDTLGNRKTGDTAGTEQYPYLTCEIGGGMETSYHRRMNLDPRDVESVALCQLGSGSSLMGYYMFHGGQNPEGKLTTLQESTATGYPNDLPVKNYDFNAPIGEYGQINPQYHWLRRLHLFLQDFGGQLAQMPVTLPELSPTNKNDPATLRWAVRSDGRSGCVFVNNYQRLQPMPARKNVQFKLNLTGGELMLPSQPVTIPADEFFFWPFNLDLGGARLICATAQPICKIDADGVRTFFFAETPGVNAEFDFDPQTVSSASDFRNVKTGRAAAIQLKTKSGGRIQIVLLDREDSLALWKMKFAGCERAFLSQAGLLMDGDKLEISSDDIKHLNVEMFPASKKFAGTTDGIFQRLKLPAAKAVSFAIKTTLLKPAGPPRVIPLGGRSHLAIAPDEADFTNAAVWKITLPAKLDLNLNPLLRVRYVGDVARFTLNGKLLDDDFYSGRTFDLGLNRYAPQILTGDLRLEILPLRRDAPIYLEQKARPDFGSHESLLQLQSVKIVNCYHVELEN